MALYDWCCNYKNNDTSAELELEIGDIFGGPWFAWVKMFTITAVYHLDVGDPYDVFFTAEVEDGESISASTQYVKETFAATRELLTTYSSDVRIAGVITEDAVGLSSVSILGISTDINGKYLATKTSPFTGTAEPSKSGYVFTPETVDYDTLVQYAVDDYTAESTLPTKAKTPTPTDTATDVILNQTTITWEDGGGATSYDVYYGEDEAGLTLVSEGQAGLSFTITGIDYGSPFDYLTSRAWRIDAVNDAGTTTGDVWTFAAIAFDPPLPTGVTLDAEGDPTGTPTGESGMLTIKRLVVAAYNKIYYEDI